MKISSIAAKLCLITTAVLSLADVILRIISLFTCFDAEIGYFAPTLLSSVLVALPIAAALLAIAFSLLIPKNTLPTVWPEPERDLSPVFPFALFASGGMWLLWAAVTENTAGKLTILAGILGLLSAFYYFILFTAPTSKTRKPTLVAVMGYAPILWGLVSTAETYTDQFTTMNSPIKLSLQFGFLGLMLMTTAELRFRLEKPAPRAAVCFHAIALFFCLSGGVSTLVAYTAGILDRSVHGAYAMVLLGGGIHAACRLTTYFFVSPNVPIKDLSEGNPPPTEEMTDITSDSPNDPNPTIVE
ncbi:MAG: hypothetical protein E7645_06590 [Ruminococcaceae bacterium]|nr:hypothetical protein [Oscillospiraceae bacterium]